MEQQLVFYREIEDGCKCVLRWRHPILMVREETSLGSRALVLPPAPSDEIMEWMASSLSYLRSDWGEEFAIDRKELARFFESVGEKLHAAAERAKQ